MRKCSGNTSPPPPPLSATTVGHGLLWLVGTQLYPQPYGHWGQPGNHLPCQSPSSQLSIDPPDTSNNSQPMLLAQQGWTGTICPSHALRQERSFRTKLRSHHLPLESVLVTSPSIIFLSTQPSVTAHLQPHSQPLTGHLHDA